MRVRVARARFFLVLSELFFNSFQQRQCRLYESVSPFLPDNSFDMSKVFGRNRSAADTLDSRTILLKFSANRSTVSCKLP